MTMNFFESQNLSFQKRHIGSLNDRDEMLMQSGYESIDDLIDKTIPKGIRLKQPLDLPAPMSETAVLEHLKDLSLKNKIFKNYIGQGYYDTITPSVILRNLFENPGWYTQYTPYQAEISQGRLESLLNFQTVVSDLTGLPIANASLLDEATGAAEAMSMFLAAMPKGKEHCNRFFVDDKVFRQTLNVILTRAHTIGVEVVTGDFRSTELDDSYFGLLLQYPDAEGSLEDITAFLEDARIKGILSALATDLLALSILKSPGELGADVALGNSQRFGVPLGYGGPHAGFFATKEEYKRLIPGRIIGISIDATGERALRMALQTREQHIKREKATSNICTAQALLANMAAMYAVYHGPEGLKEIAQRVHFLATKLAEGLKAGGYSLKHEHFFDTIWVKSENAGSIREKAEARMINFWYPNDGHIGISLDETTMPEDIEKILSIFAESGSAKVSSPDFNTEFRLDIPEYFHRQTDFMTHPVFNTWHSESQMMRYMKSLENKDLSLNTSMISLGSCTMKLNAATQMIPLTWNHWSRMHPFAPKAQVGGYREMMEGLSQYLATITGFDYTWLQPNSGAQGEFSGLIAIRNYLEKRGENNRNIILIPISAHGTNPASAVMAGMKVVVVKSTENGYIDVDDFEAKAKEHSANLAGTMITYPSTYGIFEESIKRICDIVHEHGGQVYMDGANMNAQVGLTSPANIGADVCHLNLHKTFAIPHGGGGPGMGPICMKAHLKADFMDLPMDELQSHNGDMRAVSAAPFGSASILLISYSYIRLLGEDGLTKSTQFAILNANYMRARLEQAYPVLYTGDNGTCAHEFIVDLRPFKASAGVEAEDVAKRLMDYGFHAPTLSFPVPGTMMIEPTESEDKAELDRFCDAMLHIRKEIELVENGKMDKVNNPLKNAPHTQQSVIADAWDRPYSRETAAFPLPYVQKSKFWPSVSRLNNTYGDRNLICACEPTASYA